jgi:hypothetical protein
MLIRAKSLTNVLPIPGISNKFDFVMNASKSVYSQNITVTFSSDHGHPNFTMPRKTLKPPMIGDPTHSSAKPCSEGV